MVFRCMKEFCSSCASAMSRSELHRRLYGLWFHKCWLYVACANPNDDKVDDVVSVFCCTQNKLIHRPNVRIV